MTDRVAVTDRCRCWQYGRCLADCPSAHLTPPSAIYWWDKRAGEWVTSAEATKRDVKRSEARDEL